MRKLNRFITMHRIRVQFSLPKRGEDKSVDRSIAAAVRTLFIKGPTADAEKGLEGESLDIYRRLRNNDGFVKDRLKLFLRLWHLQLTVEGQQEMADSIASKYCTLYQKALVPMDASVLPKEYAALKEAERAERERDQRKPKMRLISVRLQHFALIAPVLSLIFVISGYLYTKIVYGHFGVDASQFFTLGDYLAGSINQIWFALAAITLYLSIVVFMYRRNLEYDTEPFFKDAHKFPGALAIVLIILIGFFAFLRLAYVREWVIFWFLVPMSFILVENRVARIVARFFNNPFQVTAAVMLALLFSVSIVSQSVRKIVSVEKSREQKTFVVQTADKEFTNEEFVFLGRNQRYIFLFKKGAGTQIIPLEQIKEMSMFDAKSERPDP